MTKEHQPQHGYTKSGKAVHGHIWDHFKADSLYGRINKKIAVGIVVAVGSMTCAYAFGILAIAGLPTALKPGNIGLLFWISSDFLQLTLLSVIIVGQNLMGKAADVRAEKTFEDTELVADRLDTHTKGGITEILDRLDKLEANLKKGKK